MAGGWEVFGDGGGGGCRLRGGVWTLLVLWSGNGVFIYIVSLSCLRKKLSLVLREKCCGSLQYFGSSISDFVVLVVADENRRLLQLVRYLQD